MKNRLNPIFVSLIVIGSAAIAQAATFNWNGATTGGETGVSDTWDTVTANWSGAGTTWPAVSTGDAVADFGGKAGTVALDTDVTTNKIIFSSGNYIVGADNTAGTITLDGVDPTITSTGGTFNTIGAVIQGSSGLTKTGPTTVQLRGVNTYTGDTKVLGGTLLIGLSSNRLPTTTNLILGDGVTNANGVFQMNSRNQQVGGLETAGTGDGNRVINGNSTTSTFTVANTTDQTFGGILGGTGTNHSNFNFTKTGAGRLTLTSENTHTGTTAISGGILELGHATNTLADAGPVNVNGGTLDISDKTETVGALTVTSGSLTGTSGVLTATSCAGKSGTVSAILASTNNLSGTNTTWLTKDTSGNLELSAANTFTGNITSTAGRITLANSQALGVADPDPEGSNRKGIISQGSSRSIWLKGGITIPSNIDFWVASNSFDGGGINNESDDNEIQSQINFSTGNGSLNISSADGTLTISGNIRMTASTRTLYLGGVSEEDNTISGNITETSSNGNPNPAIMPVIKQGDGKWILSGTNTYKGDTTVNGGTLVFANGGSQRFYPKADASSNRITGNGDGILSLDGALDIDLTEAATAPDDTSWLLVDVDNVDEIFGINFSVTGFTEALAGTWTSNSGGSLYTFTESDGRLVKTAATNSPFQDWMSTNFPLVSPNGAGDDPDGDGVNNLAEFAFSGNPGDGSNNGLKRFGIEDVGGTNHLTYTFACRSGATFAGTAPAIASVDGVDYSVRASLDLSAFTLAVDEVSPAITTGLPAAPVGYTYRTFRVTDPQSTNPKAFIQVKTSPTAP